MSDAPGAHPPDSRDGSGADFGEAATGVVATLLDYLHARLELLALEAREARSDLLQRVACVVTGAFFLLVTHAALCVALVGWLSESLGWPWPLTTLGLAGAHGAAAFLLLILAKRKFSQKPFRDSLDELERDRDWLRRGRDRSRPPR